MSTDMRDMHDRGEERYLTPAEAAATLPITSADSIRRWIRSGRLPAQVLPNGRYLVKQADVEALLRPVMASAVSAGEPAETAPPGQPVLSWPSPASPAAAGGVS